MESNGTPKNATWEITFYQKMEFSVVTVRNLTSANVIGSGSSGVVYRVTTPNGESLAMKKKWSSEESGAFNSEIETLSSIRHRNIVRLLGWGSNHLVKPLFYDYIPNGSLSSLLHGARKGGAEWETGYDIVLGVVLLGTCLESYLADFGLAEVVNNSSNDDFSKQSQKPYLAGSYGFMVPEHALMQRITKKSYIYSYGVAVLEVSTERHPLDPTFRS